MGGSQGRDDIEIVSLERLQNREVYSRYAPGRSERETVMFHGCKTESNEKSIMERGFQVNKCVSGGANYGTWFAFNAAYSNGGFVYYDNARDVRHMFLCAESDKYVVRDTPDMRVVGQDCAYPLWRLRYKYQRRYMAPPVHTGPLLNIMLGTKIVSLLRPVRKKRKQNPPVRVFSEVRDGRWTRFSIDD